MSGFIGFKIITHTSNGTNEDTVSRSSFEIGRNVSCDVPIMASGVSRLHLSVTERDGKIYIKDLESTNGTFLKGKNLEPQKEVEYEVGTKVCLGQAGCYILIEPLMAAKVTEEREFKEEKTVVHQEKSVASPKPAETTRPTYENFENDVIQPQEAALREDKGVFNFFGTRKTKLSPFEKEKAAKMAQVEKLIKKRIKEAEASIKSGIKKAREQAAQIINESQVEASDVENRLREKVKQEKEKLSIKLQEKETAYLEKEERLQSEYEENFSKREKEFFERKEEDQKLIVKIESKKNEISDLEASIESLANQEKTFKSNKEEVEKKFLVLSEKFQEKEKALNTEIEILDKEVLNRKTHLEDINALQKENLKEHSSNLEELKNTYNEVSERLQSERELSRELSEENKALKIELKDVSKKVKEKGLKFKELTENYEGLDEDFKNRESVFSLDLKKRKEELQDYCAAEEKNAKQLLNEAEITLINVKKEDEEFKKKAKDRIANAEEDAQRIIKSAEMKIENYELSEKTRIGDEVFKIKKEGDEALSLAREKLAEAKRKSDRLIEKTHADMEAFEKSEKLRVGEELLEAKEERSKVLKSIDEQISISKKEAEEILNAAHKKAEEFEVSEKKRVDDDLFQAKEEKERAVAEAEKILIDVEKKSLELMTLAKEEVEEFKNTEKLRVRSEANEFKKESEQVLKRSEDVLLEAKKEANDIIKAHKESAKDFEEAERLRVTTGLDEMKKEGELALSEADKILSEARAESTLLLTKADESLIAAKKEGSELLKKYKEEAQQLKISEKQRMEAELSEAKKEANRILNESKLKAKKSMSSADKLLQESKDESERILNEAELSFLEAKKESSQILKKSKHDAEEFEKSERIRVDELLSSSKKEARELSKEASKKIEDANIKSIEILREARERAEEFEKEETLRVENSLSAAKEESETLLPKAEDRVKRFEEAERVKVENEIAEIKIKKTKELEAYMDEEKRLLSSYKKEYAQSWSQAISFALKKKLSNEYAHIELQDREKIQVEVLELSDSILRGEAPGEEGEVRNLMNFDPKMNEKVKKYWKKVAITASLAIFGMAISPYLFSSLKKQAVDIAEKSSKESEERIKKMEADRDALTAFNPDKKEEYLESYTQRVLYTKDYVVNELDKKYREEWFLNLDSFFVEDLVLSDETIVTFLSKETNFIKEMQEMYKLINAQFLDESVERMEDLEEKFVKDVKGILKSKRNYKKFIAFKQNFYTKSHPFGAERGLANTKDEK